MREKPGKFIVFEGIDGSGKSTQVQLIAQKLRDQGYKVHVTAEPTTSPIGSLIRNAMTGRVNFSHETIAALFAADRIDHIMNDFDGLKKKLDDGMIVISDRYYFSSYAYHSVYVPMDWVIDMNSLSSSLLKPDLNIYLDINVEKSMKRLNSKRQHLELYENSESMKKVRDKYFEAFEIMKDKENISILDADKSTDEISEMIWDLVKNIL